MSDRLTAEYCDRHYNLMPPEAIGQLLASLEARSAKARESLSGHLDVRYGEGADETADVFLPAEGRASAALLFIHGGYWIFGDKSQFSFPAVAFAKAGFAFIPVNYTLAPKATLEEQVAQCRRAVAFVHEHAGDFRMDADRLCICGHSSGGQLATMMMATDWPSWRRGLPGDVLKGGLTLSGLHDLEAIRRTGFLNAILQLDASRAAALSPSLLPEPGVPLYAALGGLENAEFQRQTRVLCDSWKAVLRREMVMPGIDHFSILDSLGDARSPLFEAALEMLSGR